MRSAKKEKSNFKLDKEKYYFVEFGTTHPFFLKRIRAWINDVQLHCIAVIRLGHFVKRADKKNKVLGFIFKIPFHFLNKCMKIIHKIYICPNTEIGAGFLPLHSFNILIGLSKIGVNCNILHNVTIRSREFSEEGKVDINTIGNNVWIGTGSIILGNIRIGDGATISAGSVLSKNVPDGCLVAGNPARVIQKDYDNRELLFGLNPKNRETSELNELEADLMRKSSMSK